MTAVLHARLVDKGAARWGAPMSEIFPELSMQQGAAAVTIDELLRHQSGLINDDVWSREKSAAYQRDARPPTEQRLDFAGQVLAQAPTDATGTFAYANANYILAGAVVERLTGRSWEEAVQAELFEPLGMASVGQGLPEGDNPWGRRVIGPGQRGAVDPINSLDNPPIMAPAGRLHMTVADYAKFLRLYLADGAGLLAPETVRRITTRRPGEGRASTYGWVFADDGALGHEGSNSSWHIVTRMAPDLSRAAFCVTNQVAPVEPGNRTMARRLLEIHAA